jgi:hypothetical protein
VTEDLDNDNEGDVPLEGVLITLKEANSTVVLGTTLTDADGFYVFTDIGDGEYVVLQTNLNDTFMNNVYVIYLTTSLTATVNQHYDLVSQGVTMARCLFESVYHHTLASGSLFGMSEGGMNLWTVSTRNGFKSS